MPFTGGKLQLKGGLQPPPGVKKKKSKKPKQDKELAKEDEDKKVTPQGYFLEGEEVTDKRTEAEKRYDAVMAARATDKTKKLALTTHRERVDKLNKYLSELSEHHDIPKVGPG